jgi:hypothetical protein
MKNKSARWILAASLLVPTMGLWGADDATNPIVHPVTAYDAHVVKTDATNVVVSAQEKAEAKAALNQAKVDYHMSVRDHGETSDVAKAAKQRLAKARRKYHASARKTSDARHDLHEDKEKVKQDKAAQNP